MRSCLGEPGGVRHEPDLPDLRRRPDYLDVPGRPRLQRPAQSGPWDPGPATVPAQGGLEEKEILEVGGNPKEASEDLVREIQARVDRRETPRDMPLRLEPGEEDLRLFEGLH